MKFNDLLPKIEQYKSLPDTLEAHIEFEPPPRLPCVCRECDKKYSEVSMNWVEIEKEIVKHKQGEHEYKIIGICQKCSPPDDDEEQD